MPTTPGSAPGWRIEPPVSVPSPKTACPAATAAADPPEEPPGTRVGSHGLRTGPNAEFSFELPIANSSRFVLPSMTAPRSFSRTTTVASYAGMYPARIFDAAVVGMPFVPMMSLQAHGTPVSSGASPARNRASAAFACSRACSGARCSHALNGSARATSRNASASSSAETSRARRRWAASPTVRGSSRIGPLLEARLHAEEITLAVGRLREHDLDREARARLVLTHHVLERKDRRARRDRRGVDILQLLDRAEDHLQLTGEAVELLVGERDAGEAGDVLDAAPIDGRHVASLRAK